MFLKDNMAFLHIPKTADRARSLIDQYDMPTYELLKLQITDNYNFE